MKQLLIALAACGAFSSWTARAQELPAPTEPRLTEATYLITGLHCPPCTRTVETSLSHVRGIKAIKVDWKTKAARVEFDETLVPAQTIAALIAGTPHMMGRNLHYAGWLALQVPDLKDQAQGKHIQELLGKLSGVSRVAPYLDQHAVGIAFDEKGTLTSEELIAALAADGIKAENY